MAEPVLNWRDVGDDPRRPQWRVKAGSVHMAVFHVDDEFRWDAHDRATYVDGVERDRVAAMLAAETAGRGLLTESLAALGVRGLTPDQVELVVTALADRGGDLCRYAVRDGEDLRVRGKAMLELAREIEAKGLALQCSRRELMKACEALANDWRSRLNTLSMGIGMRQGVRQLLAELRNLIVDHGGSETAGSLRGVDG